jgi:hypothetical protein
LSHRHNGEWRNGLNEAQNKYQRVPTSYLFIHSIFYRMKKVYVKAALVGAMASAMMASCGGSKAVSGGDDAPYGKELAQRECQKKVDEGGWRATGIATSQQEQFAKDRAVALARNDLAGSIRAGIQSTLTTFSQEGGDALEGKSDLTTIAGQQVEQNILDIVRNSRVICNRTYYKKVKEKNAFTVEVCVEISKESLLDVYKKLKKDNKLAKEIKTEQDFLDRTEKGREEYKAKLAKEDAE